MAQNGGSARAYLVGLSRRRRSYHHGRPPRDGKRCSHTYPDYAALTTLGHAAWGAFSAWLQQPRVALCWPLPVSGCFGERLVAGPAGLVSVSPC